MDAFVGHGKRSVHEVGLVDLLTIAHLQERLPEKRALLGIQPADFGWGDHPGEAVARAIPGAAIQVLDLLHSWTNRQD
jgi:hydrogenase maturation protease